MITYLRVIKNFEGTEEDGNLVAETNLTGILTCNVLIFVGKEHTMKSTKIYTPRKFLRVRYYITFSRGILLFFLVKKCSTCMFIGKFQVNSN